MPFVSNLLLHLKSIAWVKIHVLQMTAVAYSKNREPVTARQPNKRSVTRVVKVSALNMNEKSIPVESVVMPSTTSDSASTTSNGALSAASKIRGSHKSHIHFQNLSYYKRSS